MLLFRGTSTSSIQDKFKTGKIGIQVFSIPVHQLLFHLKLSKVQQIPAKFLHFINQFSDQRHVSEKSALKIPHFNQIAQ